MKKERIILTDKMCNHRLSSDILTAMFVCDLSKRVAQVLYLKNGIAMEPVSYEKLLIKIRAKRAKGEESFKCTFKDPKKTTLIFYFKTEWSKKPIDKIDITEFSTNYGRDLAEKMIGAIEPKFIECTEKLPYETIVSILASAAEGEKFDISIIRGVVKSTLDDYKNAKIPIPPSNIAIDFFLKDENCTCLSLHPNMYCYEDNCKTIIEKIDVTEFDNNYGENAATTLIEQHLSKEKTNPDGKGK